MARHARTDAFWRSKIGIPTLGTAVPCHFDASFSSRDATTPRPLMSPDCFGLYTSCTHILYTYMGLGPYPAWALGGRTCPPMLRAGPAMLAAPGVCEHEGVPTSVVVVPLGGAPLCLCSSLLSAPSRLLVQNRVEVHRKHPCDLVPFSPRGSSLDLSIQGSEANS
jgi:hypothetical protein